MSQRIVPNKYFLTFLISPIGTRSFIFISNSFERRISSKDTLSSQRVVYY